MPSTRRDSNSRPLCYKTCALTLCYNRCPNPPPAQKLWLSLPCPVEVPVGHVFRVCSKGVDPEAGGLQVPEFVENILGIQPELAKLEGGEEYV